MNVVIIRGRLSSAPVVRTLESGSLLVSLEVSTVTPSGTVSVPVAWFDPSRPPDWDAGDEVVVTGEVRRRFFRGAAGTQSRTEVVATVVLAARQSARVQRAVDVALAGAGLTGTRPPGGSGLRSA